MNRLIKFSCFGCNKVYDADQWPCPDCSQSKKIQYIISGENSQTIAGAGIKHDQGKLRISLLQGRAVELVMKVGEMGAVKYGDHNYRKGMPVTRFINAAFRHVFIEWLFKGIDNDAESGLPHLAHGAWNILSALEQMILKPELDDRYKGEEK